MILNVGSQDALKLNVQQLGWSATIRSPGIYWICRVCDNRKRHRPFNQPALSPVEGFNRFAELARSAVEGFKTLQTDAARELARFEDFHNVRPTFNDSCRGEEEF